MHLYKECCDLLGDHLTEVAKARKPTPSQRTSMMVFGNKPEKKDKNLLILN